MFNEGVKKQKPAPSLGEISNLLANLTLPIANSYNTAPNMYNKRPRHNEDTVTPSLVLNSTPTISPTAPILISDALKYKKPEFVKIDASTDVQKLFYMFHYYNLHEKVNMDAASTSVKVRSEANLVIKFMLQQLPTLFNSKLNVTNISEVEKATWVLKKEQIKSTLSKSKPNADSAEWSEWDSTLKFASKALFDEIMRVFNLIKAPYREQVGTLHAVYLRLCSYKTELDLQNSTCNASNISSATIHNEKETVNYVPGLMNYFFSNAKKL